VLLSISCTGTTVGGSFRQREREDQKACVEVGRKRSKGREESVVALTVITTPPPGFWPKASPRGLSTSTSMFFEAVLAFTCSSLRRPPPFRVVAHLPSTSGSPWKALLYSTTTSSHGQWRSLSQQRMGAMLKICGGLTVDDEMTEGGAFC
jgi:hypothetical protein